MEVVHGIFENGIVFRIDGQPNRALPECQKNRSWPALVTEAWPGHPGSPASRMMKTLKRLGPVGRFGRILISRRNWGWLLAAFVSGASIPLAAASASLPWSTNSHPSD